jgi:hypothetical protein
MVEILVDPDSAVAGEHFAVINTLKRQRKRFSEGCVRIMNSKQQALATANSSNNEYPARVYGPSRSSEGLRLYYLIQWLDA